MGGGSAARQYQRRFLQGEREDTGKKEECGEAHWTVKTFGEYEVRRTEGGEYEFELIKKGITIGTFSEAYVEEERILFPLSRGMLFEVSEKGVREIAIPEKAALFGLIASDGSNSLRRRMHPRPHYDYSTSFYSEGKELTEKFDELSEKTYGLTPHHYVRERNGLITAVIYSKGVYYDLSDFDVKTGAYEFKVPREHLDANGKRAYVKGFFSGDGSAYLIHGERLFIRFRSKCEEGLEGLRQILMDLGFHPGKIGKDVESDTITYRFTIPSREHERFIDEIGSFKPEHIRVFEEYGRLKGEKG